MGFGANQNGVTRSTILPVFTQDLASIHFHPHPDFETLQVFTCDRLNAVLTKDSCAHNYTRPNAPLSCKRCKIGTAHAAGDTPKMDRHALSAIANSQSCIRCERNGRTATRYIGRFRLVRDFTLCINCFNRQREVERGANAKGATPVKWAHLQQATITIEDTAGEWRTLDIGLRVSRAECERYVARIHPGCVIVECFMGGIALQPAEKAPPLAAIARAPGVNVETARPRKKKHGSIDAPAPRKAMPLPVASDCEPAQTEDAPLKLDTDDFGFGDEDFSVPLWKIGKPDASDISDTDGSGSARRNGWLPPASEQDDEAYRQSFDEDEQQPAITKRKGKRTRWDSKPDVEAAARTAFFAHNTIADPEPQEPSKPAADAIVALLEVAEPVLSGSDESAQDVQPSAWDGVAVCWKDGKRHLLTDLAAARGVDPETLAIELGVCEPEGDEPDEQPSLEPVAEPAFIERTRKLTKAEKKALKKVKRAERLARPNHQPVPAAPKLVGSPKEIAYVARAFVEYAFEMAGVK